ncbi:MAG: FAD-binding monooxygenase [Anaerolineae bacterium]
MTTQQNTREHAIVLGGSLGGLFAAVVLAKHYQRVTIIERDLVHDEPESRKGQPQNQHLHGMLEPVLRFIQARMPGVEQALIDGGAIYGDWTDVVRWYYVGGYKVESPVGIHGMAISRPFLEWQVRRYVTQLPNVTLCDGTTVEGLITDESRSCVTGVRISAAGIADTLTGDLVIDTTGRGSQSPKWLTAIGYDAPEVEEVKIRLSYATREYKRDPKLDPGRGLIALFHEPPAAYGGGYLAAIEADRWIVTGSTYGAPFTTDEQDYLDHMQHLPTPDIYNIVSRAEPISDVRVFRFPADRRLRYERLKRFPAGYLVMGDAVAIVNPVYGQGMSGAALQAEVLDRVMSRKPRPDLWRAYFRGISKVIDRPWRLTVGEDFRNPITEGKMPIGTRLLNRYVTMVQRATTRDPMVYRQFLKVMHLLEPATILIQPQIVWRVLRANRQH